MAAVPRESLQVEPAVKARAANRDLNQKNNRAAHNWLKVRKALERENAHWRKGAVDDRNKLLKQREELRNTSLNLRRSDSLNSEQAAAVVPSGVTRQMSLKDVYEALLKSHREKDDAGSVRSVKSEPSLRRASTVSFEQKRIGRKPINFSLQGLQKANSNLQSKLQADDKAKRLSVDDKSNHNTRPQSGPPESHFDLNEEELSLGPTLKLPPTHLPPIRRSVGFKPRVRNFNKDEAFKARVHGTEYTLDDIRYCRYLRKRSGRTRSDPTDAKKISHFQRKSADQKER